MLPLLALGLAWADPCAREALLGRSPKVLAGPAQIDEAELIISLRYRRSRVDGLPWISLRQARLDASWHVVGERDAVLALAHGESAAAAALRDASTDGLDQAEAQRWSPVQIPGPWSACEREPGQDSPTRLITQLVWQQGVAAGGSWVHITTELEQLDRCLLRIPIEGQPRVRLTIQERGPRPPAPLQVQTPEGTNSEKGRWSWEGQSGGVVLTIPGCA